MRSNASRIAARGKGVVFGVVIVVGVLAGPALCGEQESSPAPGKPILLSPTRGRPAIIPAAGTLQIVAQIPNPGDAPTFELVSRRLPPMRVALDAPADAAGRLAEGKPVPLKLPEKLAPRTYDLVIQAGSARLTGEHCVAVSGGGEHIRLVHLSNMNIGDVSAPGFDERLIAEVNLLAPALIVATGDFLDATHDDLAGGWRQLAAYLDRFDAPALVACGDHDNLDEYSRWFAPSPAGAIDLGRARGVVLFDLPAWPVAKDAEQIRWLERTLTAPGDDRPTFVVAHDECPSLLSEWQRGDRLTEMVRATRLAAWFAGGHRDWDGVEYRELIRGAAPTLYVRTHQSSTATCDGATGVSHYRVVDLRQDRASLPGQRGAAERLPPSLAVGRLNISFDQANNGTRSQVAFTATNGHPFRLDGLAARVLVARGGGGQPWCAGATLDAAHVVGDVWECRARFDLPAKGAVHAIVGTGPSPQLPAIEVAFDTSARVALVRRQTAEGLRFLARKDGAGLVHLTNRGARVCDITPLVRLDGETLGYSLLEEPGPAATAYRLRLHPGRTVTLQVELGAIRVAAGCHELQVYLKGPPAWQPVCHPFEVTIEE